VMKFTRKSGSERRAAAPTVKPMRAPMVAPEVDLAVAALIRSHLSPVMIPPRWLVEKKLRPSMSRTGSECSLERCRKTCRNR